MAHYRGKDTTVEFSSVDISGDSRTVSYEQTADTLDDTVRGLDNRTKIASLQDGSFSYEALDTTGAWSSEWQAIAVGAVGTFVINPEGAGTGNRTVALVSLFKASLRQILCGKSRQRARNGGTPELDMARK